MFPATNRRRLQRALECPTSALIINCFQFPCLAPHTSDAALFSDENEDSLERTTHWMSDLRKIDGSIRFRDLVIPGTHDSASVTIPGWRPFSGVGRTQNVSILDQLERGARYLDIRIADSQGGGGGNLVSIWHGCLQGVSLNDILYQIEEFVTMNPGEAILLDLVAEYGKPFSAQSKLQALELVRTILSDNLCPATDLLSATLADLGSGKSSVAVMVHPRIYEKDFVVDGVEYDEKKVLQDFGFVNTHRLFHSQWHNTRKVDHLLAGSLEDIQKCTKRSKSRSQHQFHGAQLLLTPGVGGAADVVDALVGRNSLQPASQALALYQPEHLDQFLRDHAAEPWNFLQLDFIDLCPLTIRFLLSWNVPVEVDVRAAWAASDRPRDVTRQVQSWVARKRVVYSPYVLKDLVGDDGDDTTYTITSLTIAYQLGSDFFVLNMTVDEDSALLLSAFGETTHNSKVRVPPNGKGYVQDGRLCEEGSPISGAAVKFDHNGNACHMELVGV